MKKLIEQLCTTLDNGEDLVLATVCSQSGSTPRVAGARMVVHSDGRIHGARLEAALRHLRAGDASAREASDLQLARAILAR